jgi:putative transposase
MVRHRRPPSRDRDCIYGKYFRHRVKNLGIKEVLTAARSPWQNPYVERLIGSIRQECLDHVIVLNERHLRRVLRSYFQYYHRSRCHLSLDGVAPKSRPVQGPELGQVVELPEGGGLHHRYVRKQHEFPCGWVFGKHTQRFGRLMLA